MNEQTLRSKWVDAKSQLHCTLIVMAQFVREGNMKAAQLLVPEVDRLETRTETAWQNYQQTMTEGD